MGSGDKVAYAVALQLTYFGALDDADERLVIGPKGVDRFGEAGNITVFQVLAGGRFTKCRCHEGIELRGCGAATFRDDVVPADVDSNDLANVGVGESDNLVREDVIRQAGNEACWKYG